MNWLQKIAQTDLSWILSGPNEDSRVGPESGSTVSDGISIYRDSYGSYRYVYYEDGQSLAGIQVVFDGESATIANVYTRPEYQRLGLATKLFQRARSDFPNLQHSSHKTDEGDPWITSLAQKPMPLPVTVDTQEREEYSGIHRVDDKMTQETADRLRQQYPEIEYGGAGAIGIAFRTGPGEFMKITHDWNEANRAKHAFDSNMNWVVPILEEPKMIQENPPMWGIRMKELQPIEDPWLTSLITHLSNEYETGDFPDLAKFHFSLEKWNFAPKQTEEAIRIYPHVKYIFEQNQQTFGLADIHGGNVGWDDDGHLKIFDLGPGVFTDENNPDEYSS